MRGMKRIFIMIAAFAIGFWSLAGAARAATVYTATFTVSGTVPMKVGICAIFMDSIPLNEVTAVRDLVNEMVAELLSGGDVKFGGSNLYKNLNINQAITRLTSFYPGKDALVLPFVQRYKNWLGTKVVRTDLLIDPGPLGLLLEGFPAGLSYIGAVEISDAMLDLIPDEITIPSF